MSYARRHSTNVCPGNRVRYTEADSELLPALQQRCLEGRHSAARSEIVRAGLRALAQMQAKEFLALVKGVEKLKPGPGKRV